MTDTKLETELKELNQKMYMEDGLDSNGLKDGILSLDFTHVSEKSEGYQANFKRSEEIIAELCV